MVDPWSIAASILRLLQKIKNTVQSFRHNQKSCKSIVDLVDRVSRTVNNLKQLPPPPPPTTTTRRRSRIMQDMTVLTDALKGLEEILEESLKTVEREKKTNVARRFVDAGGIAKKLSHVRDEISLSLLAASFAATAYGNSVSASVKESVDALDAKVEQLLAAVRARDASGSGSSRLASLIKEIANDLRLPPAEVQRLVQTYGTSSSDDANYHHQSKKPKTAGTTEKQSDSKWIRTAPHGDDGKKSPTSESETTQSINKASSSSSSKSLVEIMEPRETSSITEPYQIIRQRTTKNGTILRPIEVHPKKTWVVMTSEGVAGCVIWDYQKQKEVSEFQVKKKQRVCSAKFIVQKEWLAVGTGDGSTYIYSYTGTGELRELYSFKAYDGCSEEEIKAYADKAIKSLAVSVHPREPRLLLAFGRWIMQWKYLNKDNTWERNRKFESRSAVVRSLKYNPRGGAETFITVTRDNKAKIYTTEPSNDGPITLEGTSSADYYPTGNNQHWVVTCQSESSSSKIWDWKTKNVVRTLEVSGRKMVQVASHPTHQILATYTVPKDKDKRNTKNKGTCSTTSEDGIIYLWDANSYRPAKMVQIPGMGSRDHSMEFATNDRNGLTRLFVKFETEIAIVEVNLPVANTRQRK